MRVFLSFAQNDAGPAAQLEAALRRNNIETWSTLDMLPGVDWTQAIDNESAQADGYVFLLGANASSNPQLQAEWRQLLRNDWESKKPLIPIVHEHEGSPSALPPFLRSRRAIFTTNVESAVDEVRHRMEHPAETIDRTREHESKAEWEQYRHQLQDFALSLRERNIEDGGRPPVGAKP